MTKKLFPVICIIFFWSCGEDDIIDKFLPPLSDQLKISQPEILSSDLSGISLHFFFEGYGPESIDEYGIVWYEEENKNLLQNCVKSIQGKPADREISLKIENGLPKERMIYVRAYAKVNDAVCYSPFVSVLSKGGKLPVITKILPEQPRVSEQIKIEGENFIRTNNAQYQSVFVNDVEIKPDSMSENAIYFTLSQEYLESYHFDYNTTVQVKTWNNKISYNGTYKLLSPWKRLNLPGSFSAFAFMRGTATVLDNKAYILFGKQYQKMFVYDMSSNDWHTVPYPENPDQAGFGAHINCYNFTHNNTVYSFINNTLYKKSGDSFLAVTKSPIEEEDYFIRIFHYYNNNLFFGRFTGMNYNYRGTRYFYKYELETNTWTNLFHIPQLSNYNLLSHFVFDLNGNLNIGTLQGSFIDDFSKHLRLWTYSISQNTWSWNYEGNYQDYPVTDESNYVTCFIVNNQVFVGLGENHYDWPEYCSNKLWKLNQENNQWIMLPQCPHQINVSATFIYKGKAYILGTEQDSSFEGENLKRDKYFYEFDPSLI